MPIYSGTQKLKSLYVGAQKIKEAWVWSGTAWQKVFTSIVLTPMRMNKSGTAPTMPANATTKIPGWTADAGHPQTSIVNDSLVVNGPGNITVTMSITRGTTFGALNDNVKIYRNGAQVAVSPNFSTGGTQTATWSGTVALGDRIEAYYTNAEFSSTNTVTGGYLQYVIT
ncbi:hypothetical protein QLG13_08075 [Rhodococcus aetherivorans]|uniref:hypothetical protein n=1 Tax=Rhodococcus aetherivorans TaxID=191292 RepID=UPI003EB6EB54